MTKPAAADPAVGPGDGNRAVGASEVAIGHHYDVPADFYALWLDRSMTYSCGSWTAADTLELAQRRKYELVAGFAGVVPGLRVLDVGCGWGGFLSYLVEAGVAHAHGLTLSANQAAYIEQWDEPRITVERCSWADHADGTYDAIVSVGAFEHFARAGVPSAVKVDAYRSFFSRCAALLPAGGRLGLQTIVVGDSPMPRERVKDLLWMFREVFPESSLPQLHELARAAQGIFTVEQLRNDADDYRRTCEVWLARLQANTELAQACAGPEVVRRYERYLTISRDMFAGGHTGLLRLALRRA
jgi:cyclopropane-fatty-acyl-phospholipid synthase